VCSCMVLLCWLSRAPWLWNHSHARCVALCRVVGGVS
jgi:hypothetical protein